MKRKILFTSHTANFHKFNRPLMRMLRGTLEEPYKELNIGGWQVDYACANEEPVHDADNVFTINFARNPLRFDKHTRAYHQLKKIIDEGNYDAIHTHTPVGSIITRLAARKAKKHGTKIIYTSHGFHFYDGAPKKNWLLYYRAERNAAKYTDLLITINREDYRRAKKDFGCPVEMIDGVGVDTARFAKTTKAEQAEARAKFGLDKDDFVICYLAEFTKNKNQRTLVEAAAPIMKENPKLKLIFLGEGPCMNEVKALAKELGVQKQCLFPGYVRSKYAALVQSCNLYVSLSIREGLGLGVLEALYCGLPIIVSDNRGHRDIVDNNKKYLVSPMDAAALTKKLREAIRHPAEYKFEFPERYTLSNSLSEMKAIYEEILG